VLLIHDFVQGHAGFELVAGALVGFETSVIGFEPTHKQDTRASGVTAAVTEWLEHASTVDGVDLFVVAIGSATAAALSASGRASANVRALALISPRTTRGRWPPAIRESATPKLIAVGADDARAVRSMRSLEAKLVGPRLGIRIPTGEQGLALLQSEWGSQVLEHIGVFFNRSRRAGRLPETVR